MTEEVRAEVRAEDLREVWLLLTPEERVESFATLSREEADDFFLAISPRAQAQILRGCPLGERRLWLRVLPPDDVVDALQEFEPEEREQYLELLAPTTRREVHALLAYEEDQAGGLMSPRFARVRPSMTVDEAVRYVRRQAHSQRDELETINYVYVLGPDLVLAGVLSFRELLTSPGEVLVSEIMERDLISVPVDMDEEQVARIIAQHDLLAVPVVDSAGRMHGIVTVDDIVDVVERGATEDVHRFGGLEALDIPYLQTPLLAMLKKRAGWLAVLFVGEMLTASAMARYEAAISHAVVLALFVPLIISSGGNSGSQAATLVIRAMALGEVRLREWGLILRRELIAGLALGAILALFGFVRILSWEALFGSYGEHADLLAITVAASLIGIVTWGTLAGSMLPFLLRRAGFDPASASAPLVATLVDVSGVVIYFSVAGFVLRGTLL